jgi:hypothetical protein
MAWPQSLSMMQSPVMQDQGGKANTMLITNSVLKASPHMHTQMDEWRLCLLCDASSSL